MDFDLTASQHASTSTKEEEAWNWPSKAKEEEEGGVDVDSATHTINQRLSQIACHFISTFVHSFHSHFVFFGNDHLTIF